MTIDFNPARRNVLRVLAFGVVAAPVLVACKKTLTCDDTNSLPTADVQARAGALYVDKAADPMKACNNCNFFKPVGAEACGGCLVLKGPIHPNGTCKLWAAKIAPAG